MIIGTCTLNCIIEAMKESELDNLSSPWELIRHSQEFIGQARRVSWRTSGLIYKSGSVDRADKVLYAYDRQLLEPYATYHIRDKRKTRVIDTGQYVLIHKCIGRR